MNGVASYRFGAYEVRVGTRQLLRDGHPVAIQPKPLELLLYLIARRDRVVPREEVLEAVWSGVCVQAQAVGFVVHALRRAVGDDGRRQAVIRTVARTGFRFVAPVEELGFVEVASARPARGSGAVPGATFVGRAHLLAAGQALLDEVRGGGGGGLLLVSGEAGIGKTRALEQLMEGAAGQGFRVLLGRCVESEGAPAFWPWVQVLRAAASEDPPARLLRVLAEGAREVAWLVPELRAHVRSLPEAPTLEPRTARFLMCDSVVTFLRELTAESPHVLCFDDLHRADTASLAVLRHVAQELGGLRLAVLGSYREAELRASPERSEAMTGVASLPHSRHEPLRGFNPGEVEALVNDLSGRKASEAVVCDLYEKTGGNPFFVDQILRVLESEGRLGVLEAEESLELSLPPHVQEAVRRQVALLPEASRALVELASVIGRDFRVGELEGASGLARAEVLSHLSAPSEVGIIRRESEEDPNRYRFAHVLVRDALYAGLSAEERARGHTRVGHAIARLCGEDPGPRSAELAHHFLRADTAEELKRAIHYAREAARWASERGAVEEAPGHLERALRLLEQRPPDERLRCEILIQYGDALTQNSRREDARAALIEAARIAKRHDDAEGLARAALRYAPDFLAIDTGWVDWDLVRLLEESIDRLPERSALRGRLQGCLAVLLNWCGGQERIRKLCAAAREIAESSADEGAALFIDTAGRIAQHRLEDAVHCSTLSIAMVPGEESTVLLRSVLRLTAMLQLGLASGLDDAIDSFAALAREARQPQAMWYEGLFRATWALTKGDYASWERHANRYLKLGQDIQDPNAALSHRLQRILTGFDRGDPHLREFTEETVEQYPRIKGWLSVLVAVYCELGCFDQGRESLDRALDAGLLEAPRSREWFGVVGPLALAAHRLDDERVAEPVYEQLAPFAGQFAVIGYGSSCWGAIDRFLGLAAAAAGRNDDAVAHLRAAVRMNESLGAAPALAHCCFELAELLDEKGDPGAPAARARAAGLARRLGMDRLEAKLRERWPS